MSSTAMKHRVSAGENLTQIAESHGVSLSDIRVQNPSLFRNGTDASGHVRDLRGNKIYAGDEIILRTESAPARSTSFMAGLTRGVDVNWKGASATLGKAQAFLSDYLAKQQAAPQSGAPAAQAESQDEEVVIVQGESAVEPAEGAFFVSFEDALNALGEMDSIPEALLEKQVYIEEATHEAGHYFSIGDLVKMDPSLEAKIQGSEEEIRAASAESQPKASREPVRIPAMRLYADISRKPQKIRINTEEIFSGKKLIF